MWLLVLLEEISVSSSCTLQIVEEDDGSPPSNILSNGVILMFRFIFADGVGDEEAMIMEWSFIWLCQDGCFGSCRSALKICARAIACWRCDVACALSMQLELVWNAVK